MPDLGLTHGEAQDLASYPLREQKITVTEPTKKGNREAVALRREYTGIGKHGIGVGAQVPAKV